MNVLPVLIGFRGTSLNDEVKRLVDDIVVHGLVLTDYDIATKTYGRNIKSPEQVRQLIHDIRCYAGRPLCFAVDAEGGRVLRLKSACGFVAMPSAQDFADLPTEAAAYHADALANQLAQLGFNLNFAPVVDINRNPDCPPIGTLQRSYGTTAKDVIRCARTILHAHRKYGVMCCLKHFPGHGSSLVDSHTEITDITDTWNEAELNPYRILIQEKLVDAVMPGHLWQRHGDPHQPATFSQHWLQTVLRSQLGFEGKIISDDLQMRALYTGRTQNVGQAAANAFDAGCDLLVSMNNLGNYDPDLGKTLRDALLHRQR